MDDYISIPDKNYEEIIEQESNKSNMTINDLEVLINNIIKGIPVLDRNKIREEISKMEISVPEAPTTYDINKGLALSQAYRDRLTEIYYKISKEVKIRKRCLEMLFDANNLISKASSADKRKGEATLKYPMLVLQLESASAFLIEIEQILNNMKNTFDTYSRAGSILALQVQLGEYKRKNNDFDNFESDAEEVDRKPITELSW